MRLPQAMLAKLKSPKFSIPKLGSNLEKHSARLSFALLSSAIVLSGIPGLSSLPGLALQRGLAQSTPTCDPPGATEYLLLVINQSAGTEEQLRQLLPENAVIVSCQYLDDPVVRVGGFASTEIAEAWAKYVTDTTGLQAFVAGPTSGTEAPAAAAPTPAQPESPSANQPLTFPTPTQTPATEVTSSSANAPAPTSANTAQDAPSQNATSELPSLNQSSTPTTATPDLSTPDSSTAPSPTAPSPSPATSSPNPSPPATGATSTNPVFAPEPLGAGYAVLVNYFNRPEVAIDVQQITSQPVGLVSYNQRPFLLAAHTTDPTAATAVLQSLNDRGFNAILIDSRSAVLLTPAVIGTGG